MIAIDLSKEGVRDAQYNKLILLEILIDQQVQHSFLLLTKQKKPF